ncbi:MAG: cobalamin-dependent protein [Deltaproteobacteria bacterium]|nr:cobalamin-dependent protein [Deltaproteobacteria bacterium]
MRFGFVHLGRENLGVEYLSSVLKEHGHHTSLYYDPGLFGPNDNVFYVKPLERRFSRFHKVVRGILDDRPDYLMLSAYTNTFPWLLTVLKTVRDAGWNGKVLVGGIHATLTPEVTLRASGADAVVVGEAEAMIMDLVDALEGGRRLADVGNIAYLDGDRVVRTPMLPAIPDLDVVPLPDKPMFEAEINYEDDYMIMTGRGCPLSCTFCCEASMNRIYKNR